jgi:hypothetical protein
MRLANGSASVVDEKKLHPTMVNLLAKFKENKDEKIIGENRSYLELFS